MTKTADAKKKRQKKYQHESVLDESGTSLRLAAFGCGATNHGFFETLINAVLDSAKEEGIPG